MTKIRINDGDYAGYLRETLGSQGTQAGTATVGSPVLNEAMAAQMFAYVPPAPTGPNTAGAFTHWRLTLRAPPSVGPEWIVNEAYMFDESDTDVSGLATATASTTHPTLLGSGGATNLNDDQLGGGGTDAWASTTPGVIGDWFQYTFASAVKVRRIQLINYNPGYGGHQYTLSASNDGSTWLQIAEVNLAPSANQNFPVVPGAAV